jgi:hypothetical protein
MDTQWFLSQVKAQMPPPPPMPVQQARMVPQEPGPAKDGRVPLPNHPASAQPNVSNMPVFTKPGMADLQAAEVSDKLIESKRYGTQFDQRTVEGMSPENQMWAYRMAEGSPGLGDLPPDYAAEIEAERAKAAQQTYRTPNVFVNPDMAYVPHLPGSPEGGTTNAIPGSKQHIVEHTFGRRADVLDALQAVHGEYQSGPTWDKALELTAPKLLAPLHPVEGEKPKPVTAGDAAVAISGALAAQRMRIMGAADPTFGAQQPGGTLDPLLLAAYKPGGST